MKTKFTAFTGLCSADYLRSPEELAPSLPPPWLKITLVAAIVFFLAVFTLTMIGPMDEFVAASGEVRPAHYAVAFSRAEGVLKEVLVKDGQAVKKGDVLARLDSWEADKVIANTQNDLLQAQAELKMAHAVREKIDALPVPPEFFFSPLERERQQEVKEVQQDHLDRLEKLQKSGAVSPLELLNQKLQLIAAESQLKRNEMAVALKDGPYGKASQKEAEEREQVIEARIRALGNNLKTAQEDRKRYEVLSTEDGVVLATTQRFAGEKIPIGSPMFKISQLDRQELRLYATEDRLQLIQPGQVVRFKARSNADKLAKPSIARVTEVALDRDLQDVSTDGAPQGSYKVKASIESSAYALPMGGQVDAEIILKSRPFWKMMSSGNEVEIKGLGPDLTPQTLSQCGREWHFSVAQQGRFE